MLDYRGEIVVMTKEHPTLNTFKGLIRCPDIEFLNEKEIITGLKGQRVEEVDTMKRKVNGRLAIPEQQQPHLRQEKFLACKTSILPTETGIVHPKAHAVQNVHEVWSYKKWSKGEIICANYSESEHLNTCKKNKMCEVRRITQYAPQKLFYLPGRNGDKQN